MSTAAESTPTRAPGAIVKVAVAAVIGLAIIGCSLALLVSRLTAFGLRPGLFGTRASLLADFNLIAEIILLLGLTVGYGLARRGSITAHQYNQTFWVLFNIVLVMFIMLVSFSRQVVPGIPARLLRAYYAASFIHSMLGGLTIVLAVYLLLRMNRLLPKFLRISWWKNLMRLTLGLYWVVGLFGLGTYYIWYVQPRDEVDVETTPQPVAETGTVVVPVANYAFNPGTLEIPAGTTVIFRNDDPDPHTVTSDSGAFAEGILEEQDEYSVTFDTVGEFPYFCLYHGAAGGVGMAGVVRVVEPGQVAALPTAVAPPAPTPQPTAAEPPAEPLGPSSVGYGAFRDANAHNDTFDLHMSGVPAALNGDLHAWLVGGSSPLHMGRLAPDAAGNALVSYTDANGANLLATYTGFVVTLEAAGSAPAAPSSTVIVGSNLPGGAVGPLRQLLVASSDAPEQTPYTLGLIRLSEELFRHARAVNGAALIGDFDGMNRHIEHMLTIVQGHGGEHYRDFDNNGEIQDPGDGFGLLRYAEAAAAQAQAAAAAPDATDNVRAHAANVQVLASNLHTWGNQVVDLVILAHQQTTAAGQQQYAAQALELTQHMLDGVDANGNGLIEALPGEGGAYTTYFFSQYMAALGAVPEPGSGLSTPVPATEAPAATEASAPAETSAPGATATPPPATEAPATEAAATATTGPVFITYRNFEIVPAQTTLKVGTQVVFLIQGSLHQPFNFTAPNTFEAPANLGDGSTYTFTFNEAGTTTILCGYHANMSATVNVVP